MHRAGYVWGMLKGGCLCMNGSSQGSVLPPLHTGSNSLLNILAEFFLHLCMLPASWLPKFCHRKPSVYIPLPGDAYLFMDFSLFCALSSLMGSRKVMTLELIWLFKKLLSWGDSDLSSFLYFKHKQHLRAFSLMCKSELVES